MIVVYLVSAYIAIVALVYVFQRKLQYAPDRTAPVKPADLQELHVKTEDGLTLLAWFSPPRDGKDVVVLYHGNASHMGERVSKMRPLIEAGYGVYFCEYRGYAGNPGSPSEVGLYHDARSALGWLTGNGYRDFIFYGESLGSGMAIQMAHESAPKRLILEGAFSSAVDVARSTYPWLPVGALLKDRFDNLSKIKSLHMPLLMLHGVTDPTIPYKLGQKLFEAANEPKKFAAITGGSHVDLHSHGATEEILQWL